MEQTSKHIVSVLMENQPGALSRLVGLFSARNFNIESLSVAPTFDDTFSRLTLTTNITDKKIDQLVKQLNKLIDVVKVVDVTHSSHIEREFMLIKVNVSKAAVKKEVLSLTQIFRGNIVDVSVDTYIIQIAGDCQKLDAFVTGIEAVNIVEMIRTGPVGMLRGSKKLKI